MALKLTHTLQKPIVIEDSTITAQASIGIAIFPCDADQQDELLRKADLALYKAKALGKNNFAYFDVDIETAAKKRQQLEQDIQQGLEKEEFEVFYQPLIDISKRQIFGVEALLRWRHPQRGMVSPVDFIPAAEDSRLIIPMGNLVLKQACQQHKRWQENGLPALIMSVNLSAVQFENDSLFNDIKHILQSSAIDPNYLTLEITESTLMDSSSHLSSDKGSIHVLQQLNELGLKIAIDDFGTGYSSLAYLKRFPIHHLKIDRAFINDLPKDIEDVAITRAILNMSQALNLTVVAEGIETEEQLAFLQAEQCQYAQGFHLGRPMSAVQFEEFFLLSKEKYNVG